MEKLFNKKLREEVVEGLYAEEMELYKKIEEAKKNNENGIPFQLRLDNVEEQLEKHLIILQALEEGRVKKESQEDEDHKYILKENNTVVFCEHSSYAGWYKLLEETGDDNLIIRNFVL